jgi:hypothetical protein
MDSQEQDHVKKMLHTYKRRLYALELKQAWHGINTPPEVLMELEDLRENIERCQSQIDAFPHIDPEPGQSQDEEVPTVGRKQIEITFNGSFDDLTPEIQSAVVRAIAGIVEIPPDQVTVLKVMAGSVIFIIELPTEAANTLLKRYESGDEIIKELDIEKVRLASEQDLPLSNLVENAAVEQEKFFTRRDYDSRFAYEMFRRALVEKNELAKKAIVDLYSSLVQRWIQRRQDRPEFERVEDINMNELVNSTFERVWKSLSPSKFEHLKSLASILSYLQSAANGAIMEYVRPFRRLSLQMELISEMQELDNQVNDEDLLNKDEFWELIKRKARNEKEYLVVFSSSLLGLSPKEILEEYSDRFRSINEIYQLKASFLERLARDSEVRDYFSKNDASEK